MSVFYECISGGEVQLGVGDEKAHKQAELYSPGYRRAPK